ncbi:rod shape-determining protein MreC [Helicobacter jaachi]|uniref:Rod shape-determining protein MreC n=1 Tax=Helicobacter jaachi TaxID=1677920 RepID=A0A4U8TBB6_9HELI|nr:rod shape-determining protein MreC [Helicobacter jaachi]TLD97206.1 rod shape-determining protein MreC [Helicobacter jaachi]
MRYKILIFGIVFFVCILVLMEVDKSIQSKILNASDYIKIFFLDSKEGIANAYERHFDQAEQIQTLKQKVADYDKLTLEIQMLKSEILKLSNLIGKGGITHEDESIHLGRVISFATLGERDRIWLESNLSAYSQKAEQKIFGIVKDNVAIGVAVIENGRLEGFLNGNENCHYDVYIGQNRAMGIVSGSNKGYLVVDYIPDWIEIHKGDKVFTSGLDGIFLENIPVGVVENVRENYGYLSADVKPYGSLNELSYVWIIDRESPQLTSTDSQNLQPDSQNAPKETLENLNSQTMQD